MLESINVSVIIPSYNSGAYISETLKSIMDQSYKPIEIIIIDDCSTDDTYESIKAFAEDSVGQIKTIRLDSNHGPSYCRNFGMRLAVSDWILFMDHDDVADERLLEKEVGQLLSFGGSKVDDWMLVHPAYREINSSGADLGRIHRWQQLKPEEVLGYEFVRNRIITTSGVLLNKAWALKAGGFDSSLKFSQDWDLWLKLAHHGGFIYVDEPLIGIRRHSANTSGSVRYFLEDERRVLEKYDVKFIEEAIGKRDLPNSRNGADYASVLIRLDKWDKVHEIAYTLIQEHPEFDMGHFLLGLCYLRKQKLNEALNSFREVLRLNSGNAAALNNYGGILLILGKRDEAERIFKSLIAIMPNYLDANHNLKLLESEGEVKPEDIKYTWRELRQELITYTS